MWLLALDMVSRLVGAIIWTEAGLFSIESYRTSDSEITIPQYSYKKIDLNMSSPKWQPFCSRITMVMTNKAVAPLPIPHPHQSASISTSQHGTIIDPPLSLSFLSR